MPDRHRALACAVSQEPGDSRKTEPNAKRTTSVENIKHDPPEVFIYIVSQGLFLDDLERSPCPSEGLEFRGVSTGV